MTESPKLSDEAAPIDAEFEPSDAKDGQAGLLTSPGWMPFGVLLIVLLLLTSYVLWSRGLPFHRAQPPDRAEAVSPNTETALNAQIETLETQLAQQTQALVSSQQTVSDLVQQVATLRDALTSAQSDLNKLDRRIADADSANGGLTVPDSLIARITALENAITQTNTAVDDSRIDALAAELANLRQEVQSAPDDNRDQTLQQASLAMIAISAEAARGRPFVLGYQQLASTLPNNTMVKGLEGYAQNGVPTQNSLQTEFGALKTLTLETAEASSGIEPGWVDQLFGDNVRVTRTAATPLIDTLERAAERLEQGDLEATISELDTLPDPHASQFNNWISDAQDRIDLDQRLDSLRLLLVSLAQ